MNKTSEIKAQLIRNKSQVPEWTSLEQLSDFLHKNMPPYEDKKYDIQKGLKYALSDQEGQGGFIIVSEDNGSLTGAIVILNTGMAGYIPENLLLFVCVHPDKRGQGLGGKLINSAIKHCDGDIKMHVEYDNPAKKLYERLGFTNKYAEMRYTKGKS